MISGSLFFYQNWLTFLLALWLSFLLTKANIRPYGRIFIYNTQYLNTLSENNQDRL